MNRIRWAVAAAALAVGASQPAAAVSRPGNDPARFERVLKAASYEVTAGKDDAGDAKLRLTKDDFNFDIFFYNCTNDRDCMSYQIQAGYDLKKGTTAEKMNDWNRDNRLVRAHIDAEGDPFIAVDVSMNAPGGTSDALLLDYVEWFLAMSDRFGEFIGFSS